VMRRSCWTRRDVTKLLASILWTGRRRAEGTNLQAPFRHEPTVCLPAPVDLEILAVPLWNAGEWAVWAASSSSSMLSVCLVRADDWLPLLSGRAWKASEIVDTSAMDQHIAAPAPVSTGL